MFSYACAKWSTVGAVLWGGEGEDTGICYVAVLGAGAADAGASDVVAAWEKEATCYALICSHTLTIADWTVFQVDWFRPGPFAAAHQACLDFSITRR